MDLEPFRSFVADPAHAAIVMDFDGSLAEIVDHPDDAQPLDGVVGMLHALVARFGRCAIVSGRPVAFLRAARYPMISSTSALDDPSRPFLFAVHQSAHSCGLLSRSIATRAAPTAGLGER